MGAVALGFIVVVTPWTIQEVVTACTGSKVWHTRVLVHQQVDCHFKLLSVAITCLRTAEKKNKYVHLTSSVILPRKKSVWTRSVYLNQSLLVGFGFIFKPNTQHCRHVLTRDCILIVMTQYHNYLNEQTTVIDCELHLSHSWLFETTLVMWGSDGRGLT